jgi:hypothetical protein
MDVEGFGDFLKSPLSSAHQWWCPEAEENRMAGYAVTRGFSRAWNARPATRKAARERARLKKAANRAARRTSNPRRVTERDVI